MGPPITMNPSRFAAKRTRSCASEKSFIICVLSLRLPLVLKVRCRVVKPDKNLIFSTTIVGALSDGWAGVAGADLRHYCQMVYGQVSKYGATNRR